MKSKLENYIKDNTLENFLLLRKEFINDTNYDPYSKDLFDLTDMLDEGKFKEAIELYPINLYLSPRAHFYKSYAYDQLEEAHKAKMESIIGGLLLKGIEMTGDGTIEKPYLVTRITDERDVLDSQQEIFSSQALSNQNGKYFDIITTESGKSIYFDITDCYTRMQVVHDSSKGNEVVNEIKKIVNTNPTKKWWQFWK